jgi:hypothetical protein
VCDLCVHVCQLCFKEQKVVLVEKINGINKIKMISIQQVWKRKNLQTANTLNHLLFPPMEVSAKKREQRNFSHLFHYYSIHFIKKSSIDVPTCFSSSDDGRTRRRSSSHIIVSRHQKFVLSVRTQSPHCVVQGVNAVDGLQGVL